MQTAYWSIKAELEDKLKSTFSDGFCLFQFCGMPFSLATAPSTFQRAVNAILTPDLGKHALA